MEYSVELVKRLIQLLSVKGAKVAEGAGIKSPNYYSWMANKPKALSDSNVKRLFEVLGIVDDQLSPRLIHRWFEDSNHAENILYVFARLKISEDVKKNSKIYNIRTYNNQKFNILKLNYPEHSVLIFCFNPSPTSSDFPIVAEKLGLGETVNGVEQIPAEIYTKWRHPSIALDTQTTLSEISEYLKDFPLPEIPTPIISHLLNPTDAINQIDVLTARYAGLRAIFGELKKEIKALNPNSLTLNKTVLSAYFKAAYKAEFDKLRSGGEPTQFDDDF